MEKKNVLVICPHPTKRGGVSYYNRLLKKYFTTERIELEFYYLKGEAHLEGFVKIVVKAIKDLFSLMKIFSNYNLIVLNPSLNLKSVLRDAFIHCIAKRIFHRRTLVFFHGWDTGFEEGIDKFGKGLFRYLFNFDKALVLSNNFKNCLRRWGFIGDDIALETTMFEPMGCQVDKDLFKIIFLSSFVETKGCREAIKTIEILAEEFPKVKLYMAGDGKLLPQLNEYVVKHNLGRNVEFRGWLEGEKKYYLLSQCGIMIFPTYGEGLPISLLEGMGMGLAVVTRPVGGIPDIFIQGENGFLVESLDPSEFAKKIKYLLENEQIWKTISERNRQVAKERFEASVVVRRLEKIYFEMTN